MYIHFGLSLTFCDWVMWFYLGPENAQQLHKTCYNLHYTLCILYNTIL